MASDLDSFIVEGTESTKQKGERCAVLSKTLFNEKDYEVDDSFKPAQSVDECHTTAELLRFAESGQCEVDARILVTDGKTRGYKKLDTKGFLESSSGKSKFKPNEVKLLEGQVDTFAYDTFSPLNSGLVGDDYVPIAGVS